MRGNVRLIKIPVKLSRAGSLMKSVEIKGISEEIYSVTPRERRNNAIRLLKKSPAALPVTFYDSISIEREGKSERIINSSRTFSSRKGIFLKKQKRKGNERYLRKNEQIISTVPTEQMSLRISSNEESFSKLFYNFEDCSQNFYRLPEGFRSSLLSPKSPMVNRFPVIKSKSPLLKPYQKTVSVFSRLKIHTLLKERLNK